MLTNKFYKTSNSFVCINFPNQMLEKINEEYNKNIRNIHIMIFTINDVKMNKIKDIILACKRRNIKITIHCFSKEDKTALKEVLQKIKENDDFRIQLTNSFQIKMSEEKRLYILKNSITLVVNNSECQTITFESL